MEDYKNSELYKQYYSLHRDEQIDFLKKHNEVIGENLAWLLIKNKFHKNRYTLFHKGKAKYFTDITTVGDLLEFNMIVLYNGLSGKEMKINSDKDRSIDRLNIHFFL